VAAGFVAASLVMMAPETLNGRVCYPELGRLAEGVTDRDVIRELMARAPAGALLVVLAGWILGSVAGGFTAARLGRKSPARHGLALGLLITVAGVANNLMLPPPLWFWIAGLIVPIPSSHAGARLVSPRPPAG